MNANTRTTVGLAILAAFVLSSAAYAQQIATIGQEVPDVKLKLSERDKDEIYLFRELRGAVAVFYFWRPTNVASVQQIAEIKALHESYFKQGVRFVSVTAATEEQSKDIMAEHGFGEIFRWNFMQSLGPYYHLGAFSEPYVAIVDPRSVLVWRGVPDSRLDQRIADLVETSKPPLGDEQRLGRRFRKAERLFSQGEFAKAYSVAHALFKLTDESISVYGKAEALIAKCEMGAAEQLTKASQLERDGELEEAARIVAEIAVRFEDPDEDKDNKRGGRRDDEGLDNVKRKAEFEIGRMNGNREMKKLIREARKNAEGEMLLDKGEALEVDEYYRLAKKTYVSVIKEHEDTDAAKEAKKRIKRMKRDKEIKAKVAEARKRDEAWRLLDIGERFAGIEHYKEARANYERVVADHPETIAADRAKERLEELPKASKDARTAKSDAKP